MCHWLFVYFTAPACPQLLFLVYILLHPYRCFSLLLHGFLHKHSKSVSSWWLWHLPFSAAHPLSPRCSGALLFHRSFLRDLFRVTFLCHPLESSTLLPHHHTHHLPFLSVLNLFMEILTSRFYIIQFLDKLSIFSP